MALGQEGQSVKSIRLYAWGTDDALADRAEKLERLTSLYWYFIRLL